MTKAKSGDKVKVHYTGKLNDGSIFDSSAEREPLEFTVGSGDVIPGFDEATVDMQPGDKKTVTIAANEAYGQHREELVFQVGKDKFPENVNPKVGDKFNLNQKDGSVVTVTVADMSEDAVSLDANHPLAGEDLTFEIELLEIQ